jgi:hypothetical protein
MNRWIEKWHRFRLRHEFDMGTSCINPQGNRVFLGKKFLVLKIYNFLYNSLGMVCHIRPTGKGLISERNRHCIRWYCFPAAVFWMSWRRARTNRSALARSRDLRIQPRHGLSHSSHRERVNQWEEQTLPQMVLLCSRQCSIYLTLILISLTVLHQLLASQQIDWIHCSGNGALNKTKCHSNWLKCAPTIQQNKWKFLSKWQKII